MKCEAVDGLLAGGRVLGEALAEQTAARGTEEGEGGAGARRALGARAAGSERERWSEARGHLPALRRTR